MPLALPLLFRSLGRKKCDRVGARIIVMGIDRLALDHSSSSTYASSISMQAPKLHTKGLHDMAHSAIIMAGSS